MSLVEGMNLVDWLEEDRSGGVSDDPKDGSFRIIERKVFIDEELPFINQVSVLGKEPSLWRTGAPTAGSRKKAQPFRKRKGTRGLEMKTLVMDLSDFIKVMEKWFSSGDTDMLLEPLLENQVSDGGFKLLLVVGIAGEGSSIEGVAGTINRISPNIAAGSADKKHGSPSIDSLSLYGMEVFCNRKFFHA